MKLAKKYLIKLIKEELEDLDGREDPPSPELIEFVRDRVLNGDTDAAIHDAVQGTGLDAGHDDVVKAIAIARKDELEKVASAFRELYKSIHNFKPEVKITDTIEDLKGRIKKLMDKQEAQKFDELVRYAKENPPSSDDPDDMRYE